MKFISASDMKFIFDANFTTTPDMKFVYEAVPETVGTETNSTDTDCASADTARDG